MTAVSFGISSKNQTDTAEGDEESHSAANSGYKTSARHVAGLMCGDSAACLRKLPSDKFNVAITSPHITGSATMVTKVSSGMSSRSRSISTR
jgi:hypothetical protein